MSRSLVAITTLPCEHRGGTMKKMLLCNSSDSLINVFEEVHGPYDFKTSTVSITVCQDIQNNINSFEAEGNATIGDILNMGMKSIQFKCKTSEEATVAKNIVESATKRAVDAFEILMAGGRAFVGKKTSRSVPFNIHIKNT